MTPALATPAFQPQNGDLIFQEGCDGDMNQAIKAATRSITDYQFTHVGIVWAKDQQHLMVIEATQPIVKITPLHDYLYPPHKSCTPHAVVGRLKPAYQSLIPQAITQARAKVGKGYDNAFDINNDQYYCSELIYQIFKEANHGIEVFPLAPMTFKSKQTGTFPTYWINHFRQLDIPIPEGQPGNNPGDLSRSELLDIVHKYPD